ncbi:YihY/virulence factor BrkB family protein [Rubellimicrobium arenae]|uniref:YihY/virulence factor BrkB family protein n=1 Tax=Rubellimicrobium arenae TaxID=2817372 RepID=UPI001B3065D2|nr:YihY/virulence factor BrkB family protein [Rubellimicrobium arenae]
MDVMDRLNISLIAAGVGFFAMLALFPTLAAIVLLWSWVADPGQINTLLDLAGQVVPPEVHQILMNQVAGVVNAGSSGKLGTATVISLFVALWSARAGVSALIRGLNAAYDIGHRQSIWRRYMADFGVTLALCGLTFVAIAAVVLAPVLIAIFPLGPLATVAAELTRWIVAIGVVMMTLGIVYRYGPNRRGHRPKWITPGAIAATLLWLVVSIAFTIYVRSFAHYNEVYGSLGAAVALLMWFYLSAYVVLFGGCLNAAIEAGGAEKLQHTLEVQQAREARARAS